MSAGMMPHMLRTSIHNMTLNGRSRLQLQVPFKSNVIVLQPSLGHVRKTSRTLLQQMVASCITGDTVFFAG